MVLPMHPTSASSLEKLRKLVGYGFEQKYDGARAFLYIRIKAECSIYNRSGVEITHRWPEIAEVVNDAVRNGGIDINAYLDGEIVMDTFNDLQKRVTLDDKFKQRMLSQTMPAKFMAFDIYNSINPYRERKKELEGIVGQITIASQPNPIRVEYVPYETDISRLAQLTREGKIEGIVAKKLDSTYASGMRNTDWYKWKKRVTMDCTVIGYTVGEGKRADTFGALVLMHNKAIVGKVGSGFSDDDIIRINSRLKMNEKYNRYTSYIDADGNHQSYIGVWYDNYFHVEVECLEKGANGVLRQPVFVRARWDLL